MKKIKTKAHIALENSIVKDFNEVNPLNEPIDTPTQMMFDFDWDGYRFDDENDGPIPVTTIDPI